MEASVDIVTGKMSFSPCKNEESRQLLHDYVTAFKGPLSCVCLTTYSDNHIKTPLVTLDVFVNRCNCCCTSGMCARAPPRTGRRGENNNLFPPPSLSLLDLQTYAGTCPGSPVPSH